MIKVGVRDWKIIEFFASFRIYKVENRGIRTLDLLTASQTRYLKKKY